MAKRRILMSDQDTGLSLEMMASSLPLVVGGLAAPVNSAVPIITGTTTEGQTLTTTPGTWSANPLSSYTYQWKRGGVAISGATASTYLLTATDVGTAITVTVTATNSQGSASATSAATAAIASMATGSLDATLTAPVISLAGAYNAYPPQIDTALDDTAIVGDAIQLQWTTDLRFLTGITSVAHPITSGEASAHAASITGLSSITSPAVNYFRARIVQSDGDYSAWSTVLLHGAVADSTPSAFVFTDVVNGTISTVYTSNTITLSGFNQPVTISVTGGEYSVDTGSGFGSWTTAAGTGYPSDQIRVRQTSSASNGTATNVIFTAGGVSDTYTVTTVVSAPPALPTSGLILNLDASDTSTLFQSIAGTGAPADGQPIGTWNDKSASAFHFTAAADDTTRPTYRTNSGLPYVEFDGTNDVLRRLAALGMYANGVITVAVALKTNSATQSGNNLPVLMEGNSAASAAVYAPIVSVGTTNDATAFMRNDANAPFTLANVTFNDLMDGTDSVGILYDSGTTMQGYDDGVASGVAKIYTRSGVLTLNRTGIGALVRNTTGTWLGVKIYAIAVWNRQLTGPEIANVTTNFGAKQGRTL